MANEKNRKYFEDILTSITNIETSTVGLGPSHYNNYEISWVVERGIEIIAEALKRVIANDPQISISNAQKIISTRNKITHEYDVIDNYQLYTIVAKHLPLSRKEVQDALDTQ